ncbi:MAG: ArsC/Spx/MgsR family protein [Pseudomonadota bacterium]|nr:ArsC/Spx/MgsR family protein [Pseudomonadota bacterium]
MLSKIPNNLKNDTDIVDFSEALNNKNSISNIKKSLKDLNQNLKKRFINKEPIDILVHLHSIAIDWELLLNKRSTTWRELPEDYKNLIDGKTCIDYFIKQPTLIKRPIIKDGQSIIIGYKPDAYQLKLNP